MKPKQKKKKKLNKKPYSIFFHIPLYMVDVMVMVGAKNKEEVMYLMKKQGVRASTCEWWLKHESLPWLLEKQAGSLINEKELEIIYHFKDWVEDEEHLKTLVHEVSHMVDSIAEYKNFVKETEARAYLTEYLFSTIKANL